MMSPICVLMMLMMNVYATDAQSLYLDNSPVLVKLEEECKIKNIDDSIISPPSITQVFFTLSESNTNFYPIKIGEILENATITDRFIRVRSSSAIYIFFSRCGTHLDRFPNHVNGSLYLSPGYVSYLQELQDVKCNNPKMDGIIELEILAETLPASGEVIIEVSEDPAFMSMYATIIHAVLIGLATFMFVGSVLTTFLYFYMFGGLH